MGKSLYVSVWLDPPKNNRGVSSNPFRHPTATLCFEPRWCTIYALTTRTSQARFYRFELAYYDFDSHTTAGMAHDVQDCYSDLPSS